MCRSIEVDPCRFGRMVRLAFGFPYSRGIISLREILDFTPSREDDKLVMAPFETVTRGVNLDFSYPLLILLCWDSDVTAKSHSAGFELNCGARPLELPSFDDVALSCSFVVLPSLVSPRRR